MGSSDSLYDKNLAALRKFREPLYRRLSANLTNPPEAAHYGQSLDAQKILSEAELPFAMMHVFFGLGRGQILDESFKSHPDRIHLVVERDISQLLHCLKIYDWSELILSPNVHLYLSYEVAALKKRLFEVFDEKKEALTYVQGFADPESLARNSEYYSNCNRAFEEAKGFTLELTGYSAEDSWRGLENTVHNLELLAHSPRIESLFGKFKGQTIISVAGGPSVDQAWPLIEAAQGKISIIGVDTVFKPFNDRGLRADLITALERDPIVGDLLRGIPVPASTSLVCPHLLLPEALDAFSGQKIFYGSTSRYLDILGLGFLRKIYSGSSAGNLNLSLAAWMGFSRIIMIGHNLAFADGSHQSHLKGTIDESREKPKSIEEIEARATGGKVLTQDGQSEVYTIMEYNMFRLQIENLIVGWPQIEWINTAAKGAKIEGAKLGNLDQLLAEFKNLPPQSQSISSFLNELSAQEVNQRTKAISLSTSKAQSRLMEIETEVRDQISKLECKDLNSLEWAKQFQMTQNPVDRALILDLLMPELFPIYRGLVALERKFKDSPKLNEVLFEKNIEYFNRILNWIPRLKNLLSQE